MENSSLIHIRDHQINLVNSFNDYYRSYYLDKCKILGSVALVANHDNTLRFTNSTTSVMKPFLVSPPKTLKLSQPALGTQGLQFWQKKHEFGDFASYFISLGALYTVHDLDRAIFDMQNICIQWGINPSRLSIAIHNTDIELCKSISDEFSRIIIDDGDISNYRHTYGLSEINGKNANIIIDGVCSNILGNITVIYQNDTPVSVELSFDSTTAGYLASDFSHPVILHDESMQNLDNVQLVDSQIASVDFKTVVAALFLENLQPISRGKSGIMRKFLIEYISIMKSEGCNVNEICNSIIQACIAELEFRKSTSINNLGNVDIPTLTPIITNWTSKLYDSIP